VSDPISQALAAMRERIGYLEMEHSTDQGRTWDTIKVLKSAPLAAAPQTFYHTHIDGRIVMYDGVGNWYRHTTKGA
jgi:hypothetical protein